ncbi:hypothetical protein ACQKM9_14115 [Viridibacillus sp. NPDC093762]|uniref:hypothetical protein n=1 Tax=Viridibacillus sp. NPDC093762 TaxID=3390720 RepID=UPI003D054411
MQQKLCEEYFDKYDKGRIENGNMSILVDHKRSNIYALIIKTIYSKQENLLIP